jgi:hypothetical protein
MKQFMLGLTALVIVTAGCSSSLQMSSHWRSGDQPLPQDSTMYVQDQGIAVGIQNDNEYLYLSVDIGDRMKQRQVIFRGLTVWFDYKGGEEKHFGVHYPVGMDRSMLEGRRQDTDERPDTSMIFPEKFSDDIEIVGPMEGEHHKMTIAETKGIDVKIENHEGTLVYLVKVPLMDNGQHAYGIGARPGTVVGVGIETGGFTQGGRGGGGQGMDEGGGSPGGGGRGGGGGFGGGRRRGGGGGGAPQGSSRPQIEPIKFWTKVKLAEG